MPNTVIAPAPQITWPYRVQYPGGFANRRSRESFRDFADVNRIVQVPGGPVAGTSGPTNVTPSGQAETGATANDAFTIIDGLPCSYTVTAPRGIGWSFPWWAAVIDGSALPAGARIPEGGVVGVIDAYFRVDFVAGGPADMVGVWLGGTLDASSGATYRNQTPGGASPGLNTGGAGFLYRADGTGYDYVAWGLGGAVAERIFVPLVGPQWNVFRFILITARPGGFAELRLEVNGSAFITRTYGSAALPVPYAATSAVNGRPTQPAMAFTGQAVTPPSGVAYAFEGKWGRFLPDGIAVQGE